MSTSTTANDAENIDTSKGTTPKTAVLSAGAAAIASPSISLPPNRFELELLSCAALLAEGSSVFVNAMLLFILYLTAPLHLEFVQSLASPAYLHFLATSGLLYQSSFLDFLRYLRYWKQPQYAKYLSYPHCLYFLDLLVPPSSDKVPSSSGEQSEITNAGVDEGEAFRREMAQVQFRNFVHEQQFYSWQFRSARLYGKGSASDEGHGSNPSVPNPDQESGAQG